MYKSYNVAVSIVALVEAWRPPSTPSFDASQAYNVLRIIHLQREVKIP